MRLLIYRNQGTSTCQVNVRHILFSQTNVQIYVSSNAIPYRFIKYDAPTAATSGTAAITLARPEANNRIDAELAEEFRDACQRIDADDDARLVVVTGSGGCFSIGRACPGQATDELEPEPEPEAWSERLERLRVADALAALTVPVIVALNGDAIGHGLELALAGDLRLAAEGSQFALSEPDSPSFPWDAFPWDGGTQRLPRLIGPAWALDLALTGRQVDAAEALRLGLVNRVAAPEELAEETERLAQAILAGGPIATRYAKEAVHQGMDLSLTQGLRMEADLSVILQSTADRAEGIASFKERRPPTFSGS